MSRRRSLFLPIALWPLLAVSAAHADTATAPAAAPWQDIRPVFEQKCYDCHGGKKTKGGVDLKKLHDDPQLATQFEMWEKVKEAIAAGDMPPDDKPALPACMAAANTPPQPRQLRDMPARLFYCARQGAALRFAWRGTPRG